MFQTKFADEVKTHILRSTTFLSENGVVCMTMWRMHIERFITKFTNTHSEYVIFFAHPLRLWL